MDITNNIREQISKDGFIVIEGIFTGAELGTIHQTILQADSSKATFRKTNDLFAIRQFLNEVPEVFSLIFNERLRSIIASIFGHDYFVTKSLYFDKPQLSNWFVAYHQDLTISVNQKLEIDDYGPWTVKQNQFAVQPPLPILKNIFTVRIHLDDTDENNGALKVIPGSHLKGIYRPETIDWTTEEERVCRVSSGGIMIMKPLLLHASNRTTNNKGRRVIHLEFSNLALAEKLEWAERKHL